MLMLKFNIISWLQYKICVHLDYDKFARNKTKVTKFRTFPKNKEIIYTYNKHKQQIIKSDKKKIL